MNFTIVGVDKNAHTRIVLNLDAFDAQDAELQAARRRPAIMIGGVFQGAVTNVDTCKSALPQLRPQEKVAA